jgi:hypothetical protein
MRRRRHYATTGNRAFVDILVVLQHESEVFDRDPSLGPTRSEPTHRLMMGDIARIHESEVDLLIDIVGSAPLERIDIFDGLDHLETVRPYSAQDVGSRFRLVYEGAEYRGRARTTTWDGTLSLEGNSIMRASVINNWNLDRGIVRHAPQMLAWKAVTTGNYGAIDFWLRTPGGGRISFKTAPVSGETAVAELGIEPRNFPAGGLDRVVRLQRLPDTMHESRLTLKRRIKVRSNGDTRLYVRAQQEDGHRMWSSPIYLFRDQAV